MAKSTPSAPSLLPNPFNLVSGLMGYISRGFSLPKKSSIGKAAKARPACADGAYTLELKDGASLSYQIRGAEHFARGMTPVVLLCGMSALMLDYERLADALVKTRPGWLYCTSSSLS